MSPYLHCRNLENVFDISSFFPLLLLTMVMRHRYFSQKCIESIDSWFGFLSNVLKSWCYSHSSEFQAPIHFRVKMKVRKKVCWSCMNYFLFIRTITRRFTFWEKIHQVPYYKSAPKLQLGRSYKYIRYISISCICNRDRICNIISYKVRTIRCVCWQCNVSEITV